MDAILTRKNAAGDTLRVYYDVDPENPRSWDCNVGRFVVAARCPYVDKEYDAGLEWENRNADEARLSKDPEVVAWLPVYAHDHSGVVMACHSFGDRWDSGQIGYIVATKTRLKELWINWPRITARRREQLIDWMLAEVETYNKYLNGEVYGYMIVGPEGVRKDACWGYYSIEDILEENKSFTLEAE